MTQKPSRFQRTAYAHRIASVADELRDWAMIYSSRSYGDYTDPHTSRQLERYASWSVDLENIVEDLQELALRVLALK